MRVRSAAGTKNGWENHEIGQCPIHLEAPTSGNKGNAPSVQDSSWEVSPGNQTTPGLGFGVRCNACLTRLWHCRWAKCSNTEPFTKQQFSQRPYHVMSLSNQRRASSARCERVAGVRRAVQISHTSSKTSCECSVFSSLHARRRASASVPSSCLSRSSMRLEYYHVLQQRPSGTGVVRWQRHRLKALLPGPRACAGASLRQSSRP